MSTYISILCSNSKHITELYFIEMWIVLGYSSLKVTRENQIHL